LISGEMARSETALETFATTVNGCSRGLWRKSPTGNDAVKEHIGGCGGIKLTSSAAISGNILT